ncbi:putative uncharacterized protein DDB_G0274435 [Anastrepha obliqua]|uniref:putative uncharacterized protein DDB_G0274435 n=1 Tax=Anastrepha obliqua TaxID=95512 RepID=UPI002409E09F|nr:putative uncharacterized protein DDB_G0274435 [Anastrepha obliqua]
MNGKSRHFTVNGFNTHAQQQQQSQQQSQSDVRNIYNNPYIPPSAPTSTPNQQQQQQTHRLQQQQQQQLLYKSIASGVVGGVGNSGANQYDYPPTASTELQHQQQLQQQQLQQHQQFQLQQQQQQQLSNVLEAENSTFTSHNKEGSGADLLTNVSNTPLCSENEADKSNLQENLRFDSDNSVLDSDYEDSTSTNNGNSSNLDDDELLNEAPTTSQRAYSRKESRTRRNLGKGYVNNAKPLRSNDDRSLEAGNDARTPSQRQSTASNLDMFWIIE